MNMPEYSIVSNSRYQEFRQRLIELADKLELPLIHAAEIVDRPREDNLAETRTKLELDRFSLVLIGAFQSGKSTLFNYLCDGRELSPVGPAGGGIRTSGCRVAAHSVNEGGIEYAMVAWRSKEQLLRSLGTPLLAYYELKGTKADKVGYLTDDVVNLADEQSRMQLASYAWKELYEEEITPETPVELLRFTLIICYFYPEFRERISCGVHQTDVDSAVCVSSYPQDWEHRWDRMSGENDTVKEPNDIRRVFRADDVAFAFCGGVDFHLDCGNLRALGCSIYDCPGLFISDWDTEIAKECIRNSDAILYQFSGDKAPTQSDWDAIQETLRVCVTFGGKEKMIFGVNLKVPQNAWGRIEKNSVLPKFHQFGFDSPRIHAIHAGIALRGYEAMRLDYNDLPLASRRAIAVDLKEWEREDSDENVVWYLRNKQLRKYISNLTEFEQDLDDYLNDTNKIDINKLSKLHRVDDLLEHAKSFAEERKYSSMLIHQGTRALKQDVEHVNGFLNVTLGILNSNIEEKKVQLESDKKRLANLTEKNREVLTNLENTIENNCNKIIDKYIRRLDDIYEKKAIPQIKKDFIELRPNVFTLLDRKKRAQKFMSRFQQTCADCFNDLKNEVKDELTHLKEVHEITDAFFRQWRAIQTDFSELESISPSPDINPELPKGWETESVGKMCPSLRVILGALTDGVDDFWEIIISILGFGILGGNAEEHAEKFIKSNSAMFRHAYRAALRNAFLRDNLDSPLKPIWDKLEEFKTACDKTIIACKKQVKQAEKILAEASSPYVQEHIQTLKHSLAEMQSKKQEIEALEQEIRDAAKL